GAHIDDGHARLHKARQEQREPDLPKAVEHHVPGKPEIIGRQVDFRLAQNAAQDALFADIDGLNPRPDGEFRLLAREAGKVANRQVSQIPLRDLGAADAPPDASPLAWLAARGQIARTRVARGRFSPATKTAPARLAGWRPSLAQVPVAALKFETVDEAIAVATGRDGAAMAKKLLPL